MVEYMQFLVMCMRTNQKKNEFLIILYMYVEMRIKQNWNTNTINP
jgi:hypothetical protein